MNHRLQQLLQNPNLSLVNNAESSVILEFSELTILKQQQNSNFQQTLIHITPQNETAVSNS